MQPSAPPTIRCVTDSYTTASFAPQSAEPSLAQVSERAAEVPAEDDRLDPGPIETDLAAVDAALARLDAGTYGMCEVCSDALAEAVLEADPLARFCAGHLPGTIS